MITKARWVIGICLIGIVDLDAIGVRAISAPPPQAAKAGYIMNTFKSNFSTSNIDFSGRKLPGYSWYQRNWMHGEPRKQLVAVDNSESVITMRGDKAVGGFPLSTIAVTKANKKANFVGIAFGGGGYFEAELAFDPEEVRHSDPSNGWPAFWSLAVENITGKGDDQWQGRPIGYAHFIEADFFEYGLSFDGKPTNQYGATMHDWYGYNKLSCHQPNNYCDFHLPESAVTAKTPDGTDFSHYHRYGFLWVPATHEHVGYSQAYFDDLAVGNHTNWQKMPAAALDTPANQSWAFSIIDRQHLALILETGLNQTMKVKSVNVWQTTDANNIRH
jgi:hypothetical protein